LQWLQFRIQPDSEILRLTQLFNQIWFAIASGNFPGHWLPSTRALAMQTGLHRNTISKVYRQLKRACRQPRAGSGIYVTAQSNGPTSNQVLSQKQNFTTKLSNKA